MKDLFGQEVRPGDIVIMVQRGTMQLKLAKVYSLTPKPMARVLPRFKKAWSTFNSSMCLNSDQIVKVDNEQVLMYILGEE